MRSPLRCVARLVLAAGLVCAGASSASATDTTPAPRGKPVGTWHAISRITMPDLDLDLARIITLHRDRTLISVDVDDQGAVNEKIPSLLNSALLGTWRRTGPHDFAFTGLFFNYEPGTGVPVSIGRASGTFGFVPGGGRDLLEGTFSSENFPLDADPLDPMAMPLADTLKTGELTLRRLRVITGD